MKKILLTLASVLIPLILPGCFQNETTIHLNPDGGGTLVEETRFGAQMLAMMDQMAAIGGGKNAQDDPVATMFSADKAAARASELGEGVVVEKSEPVSANGFKGFRVTYRFKDINQLKIAPGDSLKNVSPMGAAAAAKAEKSAVITFSFAAGTLTIHMPAVPEPKEPKAHQAAHENPSDLPDMESPETQAMMKQMLGGMKMSLKVVADSGIAQTNASHRSGNAITLMEMDMGKLLDQPEILKSLSKVDKNNPAAAIEALKGIKGVTFEAQKEITVTLQ